MRHWFLVFVPLAADLVLHSFPTRRSSDLGAAGLDDDRQVRGADFSDDRGDVLLDFRRPPVVVGDTEPAADVDVLEREDRKSTRLNSSHLGSSYAVFCLKIKRSSRGRNAST